MSKTVNYELKTNMSEKDLNELDRFISTTVKANRNINDQISTTQHKNGNNQDKNEDVKSTTYST